MKVTFVFFSLLIGAAILIAIHSILQLSGRKEFFLRLFNTELFRRAVVVSDLDLRSSTSNSTAHLTIKDGDQRDHTKPHKFTDETNVTFAHVVSHNSSNLDHTGDPISHGEINGTDHQLDKQLSVSEDQEALSKSCKYDFKIYVYEVPSYIPSIRFGREARANETLHVCKKCILEQFALEYIMTDFFSQFCGRTYDPSEADFFYLPLIRDAEYRYTLGSKGAAKRQPSTTEQALLDIVEKGSSAKWIKLFNITDKYWFAKGGSDHIIAMPAPVTNFRHETGKRGFFHYMSHLYPPIFLGVEYSLSFVKEYPICSTLKNIVLPYPTTDPDLFTGRLHAEFINRTALMYYAGGMHGDCVAVRRAMKFLVLNSTSIPGIVPDVKTVQAEREHGFRAATFCPIPVGDSPSSKRMYDVLNFGCIPVVLSDDLVWAFTRQTGGPVDHGSFSFQMPQAVVQFPAEALLRKFNNSRALLGLLPDGTMTYDILKASHSTGGSYQDGKYVNPLIQILRGVSPENIEALRAGVEATAPKYRYYLMNASMDGIPTSTRLIPQGGAIDMLAMQLSQRKSLGLDNVKEQCQAERARPHAYVDHYPCDLTMRRS